MQHIFLTSIACEVDCNCPNPCTKQTHAAPRTCMYILLNVIINVSTVISNYAYRTVHTWNVHVNRIALTYVNTTTYYEQITSLRVLRSINTRSTTTVLKRCDYIHTGAVMYSQLRYLLLCNVYDCNLNLILFSFYFHQHLYFPMLYWHIYIYAGPPRRPALLKGHFPVTDQNLSTYVSNCFNTFVSHNVIIDQQRKLCRLQ